MRVSLGNLSGAIFRSPFCGALINVWGGELDASTEFFGMCHLQLPFAGQFHIWCKNVVEKASECYHNEADGFST